MRLRVVGMSMISLAFWACGGLVKPAAVPPAGLVCDKISIASADLSADLAARVPGDCLLLPSGTWRGNFELPVDVSLIAGEGATAVLKGAAAGLPVLTIHGGARTVVRGISIDGSVGGGVAINPGPVAMSGVTVTGATQGALTVTCAGDDCSQRTVELTDCVFTQGKFGLQINGGFVHLLRGRISGSHGTGLTDGSGLVAVNGASVAMEGVLVEGNARAGVLLDGAATRATLTGVTVRDNAGRGVWAQGLRGSDTLHLVGGDLSGNVLVGLGATNAEGLVITGTTVKDTQALAVVVDLATTEQVGDGVGLFQHTGRATLTDVVLTNNARAQLLVDSAGDGVHASGTFSGGRFRAVVQRSDAGVDVPATSLDTPPPLFLVDTPMPVAP